VEPSNDGEIVFLIRRSRHAARCALAFAIVALCLTPSGAAAGVRSFAAIRQDSRTATFHVKAVSPASIVRARVASRRGDVTLSVTSVRKALKKARLLRAPLPTATARTAKVHRQRPVKARLVLVLRSRKSAAKTTTPKTTKTSSPSPTSGSSPARGTKSALGLAPISTACGFGSFHAFNLPGACWRPYSDASPFNQPLPDNPPLASTSGVNVATLTSWHDHKPISPVVGVADTDEDWSHPYYFSGASDPVFTVHCTEAWGTCDVEGLRVRIPDQARPAGADDGHMAVIDQENGWEYDFWQVRGKPAGGGTLTISWGGRTRIGTADATGLDTNATAGHYGLMAGIIRYPEIASGRIDHALFMSAKCTNGKRVFPAGGTGSGCGGPDAPPMGSRFFLDMSDAQIDALAVPAWRKPVLKAMAHYGMILGDTGGPSWAIAIESGSTYTSFGQPDPWVAFAKAQPDTVEWDNKYYLPIGDDIDWAQHLKVAAPCVSEHTC
jgi:hypothetical protein